MDFKKTYQTGEVVALVKQKDHKAFKDLYDRYAPALYSVILQIGRNKEVANKALHEVFITIWRKIDTYDPSKGSLFTWMLQIARSSAIEEGIKYYHQLTNQMPLKRDEVTHLMERSDTDNCWLKKLIYKLKDDQMMLLDLCYFKNYTDDQIAETLDIPAELVKSKIRIALTELTILLNKQ